MDTTSYMFAGYTVFWLLPTIFIIRLFMKTRELDQKMENLKKQMPSA